MPNKNGILMNKQDVIECQDLEKIRTYALHLDYIHKSQAQEIDRLCDEVRKNWSKTYMNSKFREGDLVKKINGYKFPGVVVCIFKKLDGQHRYVVECTCKECEGMLHIFSPEQLELDNEKRSRL